MDMMNGIWWMFFMNATLAIPWTIIFLFTPLIGLRLYHFRDRDECKRIQKNLSFSSHLHNGKVAGFSIGKWYMINIHVTSHSSSYETYEIWLIATKSTFERLTSQTKTEMIVSTNDTSDDDEDNEVHSAQKEIQIYERVGGYSDMYFRKRKIVPTGLTPLPHQKPILDAIIDHYEKNMHTVVYLHGSPGTGKSIMGLLIANERNGSYCSTFRPWQPGDSIGELHSDIEPSADNPVILVFDEFDIALKKIHAGIPAHNNVPIQIADKSSWNRMFDEIQWGLYPYMILLLTSNQDPSVINDMDPSYIRPGRVDLCFQMNDYSIIS